MKPITAPPKVADNLDAYVSLPTFWVHTDKELADLIWQISQQPIIALDTEFIRRTTYYPILALLQINTGTGIYLVDAPNLDLTPFWQALRQVPTLVWYACGEDLLIFYSLTNSPPLTNVFDVQISVAYLTGKLQMGYSQAVNELLDIALDKAESQSDWLARPLSAKQIQYADNDVRYLLALYQFIKDALTHTLSFECAIEDSLLYAKELHASHHTPDDKLYLEYITPDYDSTQLAALQALVAWRENIARAANEPCSFVMSKQVLREIITCMPQNIKQLALTPIKRSVLRRHGEAIIAIVKHAKTLPTDALPSLPLPRHTSKHKPFKKALENAIKTHSQATHIPANLLLRHRWINQLLYMVYQDLSINTLPDGLKGYRYQWVVDVILPLLYQYKAQIKQGFDGSMTQNSPKLSVSD